MHAIAPVWMACRVRLGPRATSPAGVRVVRLRSAATHAASSENASVAGAFPLPAGWFRWKVTGRPRRFPATFAWALSCPPAVCRVPAAAPVQRRHTEHNGHGHGWMRHASIQNPEPAGPGRSCVACRHVRNARGRSQRRAVAQPHGMMPTGPEFLARTDPLANLQGTSVGVGYSGLSSRGTGTWVRSPFRKLRPETWNGNIMEHRSQMRWNTNHI